MSDHVYRNRQLSAVDPLRDFMRKHFPNGRDGYVVEDLDIVQRVFGPNFKSDAGGHLRLIEVKRFGVSLGAAQERTFRLLDCLLRHGDAATKGDDESRYRGFFLVQLASIDPEDADCSYTVNGQKLDKAEFTAWLRFDGSKEIAPLWKD